MAKTPPAAKWPPPAAPPPVSSGMPDSGCETGCAPLPPQTRRPQRQPPAQNAPTPFPTAPAPDSGLLKPYCRSGHWQKPDPERYRYKHPESRRRPPAGSLPASIRRVAPAVPDVSSPLKNPFPWNCRWEAAWDSLCRYKFPPAPAYAERPPHAAAWGVPAPPQRPDCLHSGLRPGRIR